MIAEALDSVSLTSHDLVSVGVANQRETIVAWNRHTGQPYGNATVWQDTRSAAICDELTAGEGIDRFRSVTGLPAATYFSGPKATWMLRNVKGLADATRRGKAILGTIDSWIGWNLAGGPAGGAHVTDVTNASRTLLMDLSTLTWSAALLDLMEIDRSMMAESVPSIGRFAIGEGVLTQVPISCVLGDQHAALFGQTCFDEGEAKNTYGTGCFMLMNTSGVPVPSVSGLLTTVGYQLKGEPAVYALGGVDRHCWCPRAVVEGQPRDHCGFV